jgi:hypothetical protein
VTARDALRDALKREFGPAARSRGYRGSTPTWQKTTERGDVAIVNVQSSTYSTSAHVRCIVNMAVVPEPAQRWLASRPYSQPRHVHYSEGIFQDRLRPKGTDEGVEVWWDVYDAATAGVAVADMLSQLHAHAWDRLDTLLSQEALLSAAIAGDLGFLKRGNGNEFSFAKAQALLLMDGGPSDALNSALDSLHRSATPHSRAFGESFAKWVHIQAAAAIDR